jgi:hypothetical protein
MFEVEKGMDGRNTLLYNSFSVRQCEEREKECEKSKKSCNQTPRKREYIDDPLGVQTHILNEHGFQTIHCGSMI